MSLLLPFVLLRKDCSRDGSAVNIGCPMSNLELDWVDAFDTSEHMFLMTWMHYRKILLNLSSKTKPTWIRMIMHKLQSFFLLSSLDLTESKSLKIENDLCINKESLDDLRLLFL